LDRFAFSLSRFAVATVHTVVALLWLLAVRLPLLPWH
jgi:hypothetical protein